LFKSYLGWPFNAWGSHRRHQVHVSPAPTRRCKMENTWLNGKLASVNHRSHTPPATKSHWRQLW
jgi:hypothetical protein